MFTNTSKPDDEEVEAAIAESGSRLLTFCESQAVCWD